MSTEETSIGLTQNPSWRECIALLEESVPEVLDHIYVTNFANTTIKNEVEVIVSRVKEAFNETLYCSSWMDKDLKDSLQKKLTEMPLEVGYSDTLLNTSALEDLYRYVPRFSLNISFIEASRFIKENSYKKQLRKFKYPKEDNWRWKHSPRDSRPFHDKYGGRVEIPYALFRPPFFQQGLPSSMNYGGIGAIIASEIGYALVRGRLRNQRLRRGASSEGALASSAAGETAVEDNDDEGASNALRQRT
nr:neprilysin-2-like [Dermacentor andersoni]